MPIEQLERHCAISKNRYELPRSFTYSVRLFHCTNNNDFQLSIENSAEFVKIFPTLINKKTLLRVPYLKLQYANKESTRHRR